MQAFMNWVVEGFCHSPATNMAARFDDRIEQTPAEPARSSTPHHGDVLSDRIDVDTMEEYEKWLELRRTLRIVVTGKTGAGKSTLLNGFVGEKTGPFEQGHGLSAGTQEVASHTFMKNNVEVTVWDCPGLQDGTENEERYLQHLKDQTKSDIDIMLYCISVDDVRFDQERHGAAMLKLTEVFGRDIWKHTVIVLTFANRLVMRLRRMKLNVPLEDVFEEKLAEWKSKLQQLLRSINCTENEIIEKISVVPAGFNKPSLPGRKYWLSSVWMAIFKTLKTEVAKAAVISLSKHRFRSDPKEKYLVIPQHKPVSEDEFKNNIEEHPIVISPDMEAYLHKVGAEIVAFSSAGVVLGATIGGLVTGVASFGIGAPVGVGIGGFIGGGIGFVASSLFRAYKYRKAMKQSKAGTSSRHDDPESSDVLITPESTSDIDEPSESPREE